MKSGRAQVSLQKKRKSVHDALLRQEFLKEKILTVEKNTKDGETELHNARNTIEAEKAGINEMKDDMKSYSVPHVFEYIQQADQTYDLQHQINEWQRKESLFSRGLIIIFEKVPFSSEE